MRARLDRNKLQDLMVESRLSQNHWALKLGLSRGHFSDLINGKHPYPSPKTQQRLLEGFSVEFGALFDEEEDAPGSSGSQLASFQAAIADRYLIDSEIGRGGMGIVYLARELKHGRRVAIKVLSSEVVSGLGAAEFLREVRHTARLEHHGILTLLDSGNAAGQPYYVIPYARSGSLRARIDRQGRLTLDETRKIVSGVAAALSYAHDNHVVHCDIKPENILLSDDHPFVADFGIARVIHAETRAWGRRPGIDSSAGTPAYVSPEQAGGEPDLDGRTDVYSLACVTFEMLSGAPPFAGKTTMETVSRRFTAPVPDIRSVAPHVPARVAHVIGQGMNVDPDRRTPTVEAFRNALDRAVLQSGENRYRVHEALARMSDAIRRFVGRNKRTASAGSSPGLTGLVWGLSRDLSFALRTMRRAPAHVAVVVLTLALGIGANAAIFSIVNSLLLRPLPYPDGDALMLLRERGEQGEVMWPSYPNFTDWRTGADGFSAMAAVTFRSSVTLIASGGAVKAPVAGVSPDFFEVTAVPPLIGRPIAPAENQPGGPPVVVVSFGLWQSLLGSPADLAGVTITLGNDVADVVGVMPAGFEFLDPVDLWYPLEQNVPWNNRGAHVVRVVGRLGEDASRETARAELDVVAQSIREQYGDASQAVAVDVMELKEWVVGDTRRPLLLLFGAAGLLLLIACTNVASTVLARGAGRRREFAIRSSLGAGRQRLIRQLVTEGIVLGALGCIGGLALAWTLLRIAAVAGPVFPHSNPLTLDLTVVAVAALLSLVSSIAFAAIPALRLVDRGLFASLRASGQSGDHSANRWAWNGLIGAQAALAILLLTGAGLLTRSFKAIVTEETGYDARGVLTVDVAVPNTRYPNPTDVTNILGTLRDELLATPGVDAVGAISILPIWGSGSFVGPFRFHDGRQSDTDDISAHYRLADGGYFEAMGIPLLAGRVFNDGDGPETNHVVVINKSMADQYWPGADPIGEQISLPGMDPYRGEPLTIVGIVGEARQWNQLPGSQRTYYISYRQRPALARSMSLVVKSQRRASELVPTIRARIRDVDTNIPAEFAALSDRLGQSVADRRFTATVFGGFAATALFLVAAGVYGVLSYSVARRTREMGIRMALGAGGRQLMTMIIGETGLILVAGSVVGLVASVILSRLLQSQLFGVTPWDPVAFGAGVVLLALTGLAACYVPARRSTRVDPLVAIRTD